MKTVSVQISGRGASEVIMNGEETDRLTPAMARAAVHIAAGLGAWGTVSDGRTTYRVTSTTRKVSQEGQ
jgi:hypothetical protein